MIAAVTTMMPVAHAAPPEALDTEFLDYLAACESKDDNWTVVADEKLRKKVAKKEKAAAAPDKESKAVEVRP
jgi:hypothetical protein